MAGQRQHEECCSWTTNRSSRLNGTSGRIPALASILICTIFCICLFKTRSSATKLYRVSFDSFISLTLELYPCSRRMVVSRSQPPPEAPHQRDKDLRGDEPVCATLQQDTLNHTTQSALNEVVTLVEYVMLIYDSMASRSLKS